MLVEGGVASLLPDPWIARCVKAAEHHSMVSVKVVEDEVWEPGHEYPTRGAVQDRLPFWVVLNQVERKSYRPMKRFAAWELR
jgi:hypothetical protein